MMTRDEKPSESVGSFDDEAPLRRPILATEEPKRHNWRVFGTIAVAVLVILAAALLWRNAPGWNFHAPSMPSWDLPYLPMVVKVLWWMLIITLLWVLVILLLSRSFSALLVIAAIVTMGVLYSKLWQRPVVEVVTTTNPAVPAPATPSVIVTPPVVVNSTIVPTPPAVQAQVTATTPTGTATQTSIAIDTSNLATKSDVAAVKTEVERLGAMLTAKKATATRGTANKTTGRTKTKPAYRELKSTVYIAVAKGGSY